jgi:hypothetical protein
MIALIHRGEAVVPKQFNPAAMGFAGAGGGMSGSMHVSFDESMRHRTVGDILEAHIAREMATRR